MAFEEPIDINKNPPGASPKVRFDPPSLEVSKGGLVFWRNNDDEAHWPGRLGKDGKTIIEDYFMTNKIAPNGDTSPLFSTGQAGPIEYACSLHKDDEGNPIERGTINVT